MFNTNLLVFSRQMPVDIPEQVHLQYGERWYVGSEAGCSCTFRHLNPDSVVLGFDGQVEWYAEEPEDIEATLQFIRVIRDLVAEGCAVDCVDSWASGQQAPKPLIDTLSIHLDEMPDSSFRFFERHRFDFLR